MITNQINPAFTEYVNDTNEDVGEYGDDDWETIRYDHVDVGDHSLLLIVYDRFIAIVIGTSNWRSD